GPYGNLTLSHLAGASMLNLTINRSSGSVTQATASLIIAGATTLSQGTLALGANTTTVINGAFSTAAGTLTSGSTSKLTIGGSGTMPSSISMTGAMNILQMNRASANLNLSNTSPNNLNLTRLNIYAGSITNAGGLRMANAGTIYRTDGSLTNAIGAVGTYNVQYTTFAAADLPIGFEIPSSGSALSNFIINNTAGGIHNVSLNRVLNARGVITVTQGGLVTNNNNIFVGRNFGIAAAGTFAPGSSTITFNGTVTQAFAGPTSYTINNLIVSKGASSGFTLGSPVKIQTSFAITTNRCTANVGNGLLTLLSTPTTTAYIPALFSNSGGSSAIVGTVIVQRQLPNTNGTRAYRYITPTVTNSNVSDWQAEFPVSGTFSNPSTGTFGGVKIISANPSLFYYNPALVTGSADLGVGYVAYPSSGNSSAAPLVNGRGYAAFVRTTAPWTYDTRGTLGQNNITVNCTFSSGINGGWNLVGNPYPAPIDWDLASPLRTGGVANAIYLTDNTNNGGVGTGATISYVPGVGGTGSFDGIIASGQAFWVRASSAGTLRFRENQKFSGQTQFIREGTPENVLRIKMTTGTTQDNILVHMGDSATLGFDQKYDAYKFGAFGLNFSTLSSANDRLSINSVGKSDCNTVIPFDIQGAVLGSYKLDFSGLETFTTQVTPVLYDKVLDKRIDIASNPQYTFAVSDTASVRRRFQLLLTAPEVQTAMELTGSAICEGSSVGYISLESSQLDVKYKAVINGTTVSAEINGTGAALQIPVQINTLSDGENEITISAQRLTCDARLLDKKATLTVVKKGSITGTKPGNVCGPGSALLTATGNNALSFNWYEDSADVTPIADQHGSDFATPILNKTKTYYVSAVNTQGCEGERVAVMANVINITAATITAQGLTLTSSYEKGNQWYVDGQPIAGATGQVIEVTSSGTYSVVASADNCSTTSEGREMLITALEETSSASVRIFPNPATDKVKIEIRTKEEVQATLITQTGVEMNNVKLSGTQDLKSGEFSLGSLPDGVYFIRINEGSKVYTKKISKIK
ncbi:MAG: T9SS type A sorting domain-containing protein, partial [Chryseolinea sp.]